MKSGDYFLATKTDISFVKEFGQRSNFHKLTSGYFESDEIEAWEFSAIAAHLTNAIGIYRPVNDKQLKIFLAVTKFVDNETAQDIKDRYVQCHAHEYLRRAFVCKHINHTIKVGFQEALIAWTTGPDPVLLTFSLNLHSNVMNKTNLVNSVLEEYKNGKRYFIGLDIENESFDGQNLEGIVFDNCSLYVSFRGANLKNSRFLNGGIKTCDFREANLTNARFENLCVESSRFAKSKTDGVFFDNNSSYGQATTQSDFDNWIKFLE